MLKSLLLAGFALLVVIVVWVARYDEMHHTQRNNYKISCTQSIEKSPEATFTCDVEHSQTPDSKKDNAPWWHIFFEWPEGITVLLLLLTLGAVLWQSNETRKSAVAARQSAEAALLNATAFVNAERAWLIADIDWSDLSRILIGDGTDGKSTAIFVNLTCRNEGKSFARITEKGYVFEIVDTLPQEPDFRNIDIVHHASEHVSTNSSTEPYRIRATAIGHPSPDKMTVLYGRVRYWDVYGEHETLFGYQITSMGEIERFPGYHNYNKHI